MRQAILGVILAESACMLVLTSASILHERRVRLRAVDVALEGRADSLFGAVQDAEDAADSVMLDAREIRLPAEDMYAVLDPHGRVLGAENERSGPDLSPLHPGIRTREIDGHSYRVLERTNLRIIDREETGGSGREREVTILYAIPTDRIWHEVFEGVSFYLLASLLLVSATTAFMISLLRRLLRPLQDLSAATAAISARELSFAAPASALRVNELHPLASAISIVVSELRTAFEREHQFVGDAAHELKTAVAVVRSTLQLLLLHRRSPEDYETGLRQAVDDNTRVESLLSQMLLVARLTEVEAPSGENSDVIELAEGTVRYLRNMAEKRGVQLELASSDDVGRNLQLVPELNGSGKGFVAVHRHDLQILLNNLVVNAIEHSEAGSVVRIGISVRAAELSLRIEDSGEGISGSDMPHIFERFYRTDRSRARATGGAGLGLSIAKAIVDRAHGEIRVDSTPGVGTTVQVSLPRVA